MDNRAIGVFDSGIGGLTAVSELKRIMPDESVVYFGDTGRVPYGTRSEQTVRKYMKQGIAFLRSQNVKAVVIACNTMSVLLDENVAADLNMPCFEVVGPAVKAAAAAAKSGKIGVIGTPITVSSGEYVRRLTAINSDFSVFQAACPLFVPLVENGFVGRDNEVSRLVARQYLEPMRANGIDTLILGCTHYPLLRDVISDVMGNGVTLIDSGAEVAETVKERLIADGLSGNSGNGDKYFVSDAPSDFLKAASAILGRGVSMEQASKIDIDSISV